MKIDPRIDEWLDELATITDEPPGLTRTYLSPALERAKMRTAGWMHSVGLEVHEDQAGNLIGRLDNGNPDAGTLACGSHLDTVRNAGRFDGAMGVVTAILAADAVRSSGIRLPYHLEIVAFPDEEGVRFQTTYLGSRYYASCLGDAELAFADAAGITVGEAISSHRPRFPAPPMRRLVGYVEAHIEQGPVLESKQLPLGVVTAIAGQTRARVTVYGKAGHAGTTPMSMRSDALAGAATCILLVEKLALHTKDIVATVGQIDLVAPASNVIPGEVTFTIDIRHARDAVRHSFCHELFTAIEDHLRSRRLAVSVDVPLDAPAATFPAALSEHLAEIVSEQQAGCPMLVSGAGHDAVALGEVTDVAMLFVRCRDGLSHHPDEFAATDDIALAVNVLARFLSSFPQNA